MEISDNKSWLRSYVQKNPEVKNISFQDVATGRKQFLGVSLHGSLYVDYLKYYANSFGVGSMHIIILEQLAEHPRQVYGDLYDFIGIQSRPPDVPVIASANKARGLFRPELNHLNFYRNKNKESKVFLLNNFGLDVTHW